MTQIETYLKQMDFVIIKPGQTSGYFRVPDGDGWIHPLELTKATTLPLTWTINGKKYRICWEKCCNLFRKAVFKAKLTIPKAVKGGGMLLFAECDFYKPLVLPDTFTEFGYAMFQNVRFRSKLTIKSEIKELGNYLFTGARFRAGLEIKGAQSYRLGTGVFKDVIFEENLRMSKRVTYIGTKAFEHTQFYENFTLEYDENCEITPDAFERAIVFGDFFYIADGVRITDWQKPPLDHLQLHQSVKYHRE